ncbi:hypothetical protein EDB84DRAFT_1439651 [Lactarius hengduanensis]|nr:hypothetical protein EDB84DRAFT_1439651 [Lactarius hengduanensis]
MWAAREWGGALQPGAAPPSPRVGAQGQRANQNAQKPRPSPRARIGDHAEAPPSPCHASPEAPLYALQGRTGRVVHDRVACELGAETGTAGRGQDPTPPFAREQGSCMGRVHANPERPPLSLLHRSDARTDGVGLGRGVRNRVCTRKREWGAHPLCADLCAEQRARARGHKQRHAGGYTEWSTHLHSSSDST